MNFKINVKVHIRVKYIYTYACYIHKKFQISLVFLTIYV